MSRTRKTEKLELEPEPEPNRKPNAKKINYDDLYNAHHSI